LLFKSSLSDSEVNNGGLGSKLWRPMGVSHTRSHVESELQVEIEFLISKLKESISSLDGNLLLK
jgi:hypothetical protein